MHRPRRRAGSAHTPLHVPDPGTGVSRREEARPFIGQAGWFEEAEEHRIEAGSWAPGAPFCVVRAAHPYRNGMIFIR
jgi:hypothetical protein